MEPYTSDEVSTSAIPFSDRIIDKIKDIKNVFPVPTKAHEKKIPTVSLFYTSKSVY